MSTSSPSTATLDDLYAVEGKAELIAGRIVRFMPSGFAPALAAGNIYSKLRLYAEQSKAGLALPNGAGYALPKPIRSGRQSFCLDASYYLGTLPKNRMLFIEGTPALAVEVRSEGDYGETAEERLAAKRADYFEAGTDVVWDVDPLSRTVTVYRATSLGEANRFSSGQVVHAEPALPGLRLAVDEIFARDSPPAS